MIKKAYSILIAMVICTFVNAQSTTSDIDDMIRAGLY